MIPKNLDLRLTAALISAKAASIGTRRLGRGGGTAAPGLVAEAIDPQLLAKMTRRLPQGAVVIAGTNGKTTTARMLAAILETDGRRVLHNRSGSNLVRGVTAAFADQTSWRGDPRSDIAVIEADEAALPAIVRLTQPRVVLLNNLFRDQLDRYGELNAIVQKWLAMLENLSPKTTLVVNVDDPTLASITENVAAQRIGFGLDQQRYVLAGLPHAADTTTCRQCGTDLVYDALYSAHLGSWRCPGCGNKRPPLDVAGQDVQLDGTDSLSVTVNCGAAPSLPITTRIPGLYNVYNVVAAVAAAQTLGVSGDVIVAALKQFRPPFGRIERVYLDGRELTLVLVKNPVGFNEVLRMLTMADDGLNSPILIAINDLIADGRDISWLWDVDFELLATGNVSIATTGTRGTDMAVRLKYAGIAPGQIVAYDAELSKALQSFVASLPVGGSGYVLPTYTAMLALRRTLAELGAAESIWNQ